MCCFSNPMETPEHLEHCVRAIQGQREREGRVVVRKLRRVSTRGERGEGGREMARQKKGKIERQRVR